MTFNRSRKVGAGKYCNICWALRADVAFLSSMPFQTDSQAVTNSGGTGACTILTFIFTGSFFFCWRSLCSTIWARTRVRYLWSVRTKNPAVHGRNRLEERMKKVEEMNIPTPADTFVSHLHLDLHFKTSPMFSFSFLLSFLLHCNLF